MSVGRLERLDYYTLLGVERDANRAVIRAAFHEFARRFHPDRHLGAGPERLAQATEIYARGAEAYRVLLDGERRRQYDAGLAHGHLRWSDARNVARGSLPASFTSSEARPLLRKAQDAYRRGEWLAARDYLCLALEHEPRHGLLLEVLAEVDRKLREEA